MKILHFTGEGHDFMAGVQEYIVFFEDEDKNADENEHCAPGFKLDSSTDLIMDLPCSLPLNTTLIPKH